MSDKAGSTKIALIIGEVASYSDQCLKSALEAVYCQVDFASLATPTTATAENTIQLYKPEQLQAYRLVIYPYLANRHKKDFATLSHWLELYQQNWQGRVLVRYHPALALHNLRPYNGAAPRVRQLELARQKLSEWVQKNASYFYWSANSPAAAHELAQWGVAKHPSSMGTTPPYLALNCGSYAEQHNARYACNKTSTEIQTTRNQSTAGPSSVLIAGDYLPDTGHIKMLEILAHYRQRYTQPIGFHFIGAPIEGLAVYREAIEEQVERLGLTDCVQLSNTDNTNKDFLALCLGVDLMLTMPQRGRYLPSLVQAQAMGVPTVALQPSIGLHEGAALIHQHLYDQALRQRAVVVAYRHIARHHSPKGIEQALLSQVLNSLCH